jgi:hypothetical protein
MPTTLDLTTLDDAGFAKLYREDIEPQLQAREAERLADVRTYWSRLIPGLIGAVILTIVLYSIGWTQIAFFAGFGVAIAVGGWAYWPLSVLDNQVKLKMLNTIAEAIACKYQENGVRPAGFAEMNSLGLLPHYDRSNFEDWFNGARFKCGFDLYEAHLEQKHQDKNGTHWSTCFRGQLVRISFPKKFLGVTVVRRDRGLFNFLDRVGSKLQRVGLEDSKFEHDFEVYGSDQVEARELVHPVFMERLLALETKFSGSRIRCAFDGGDLLVAVEGRNRFEAGSMFTPLADPERVRSVVTDIAEILRLVDSMLTAEKAPLVAMGNKDIPADAGPAN